MLTNLGSHWGTVLLGNEHGCIIIYIPVPVYWVGSPLFKIWFRTNLKLILELAGNSVMAPKVESNTEF